MDPDAVARAFVEHYYRTFDSNRAGLAGLYQDSSMLTFEGAKIQGTANIVSKLTSLPFQQCAHSISTVDCQPSGPGGGMLVFVSGSLQLAGEQHTLKFSQEADMGEGKVLNKYYPQDFDPAKIPRHRQPKNEQMKVRMMFPMNIRCGTWGIYIDKGTKFNSRKEKEDVVGETYLGIQIFRFYFKCTKCSAEITFMTDPQNSDYVVESGASRNFELWRDEEAEIEKEKKKRNAEEMGDAMKSLENKALDSKQEMDIIAAIEEIRSMKSRRATVTFDSMLENLQRTAEEEERRKMEEIDAAYEQIIKSIVFHNSKDYVKRMHDDDDDFDEESFSFSSGLVESSENNLKRKSASEPKAEKPTDSFTTNSSKDGGTAGGSSVLRLRFIVKQRSAVEDSSKKPRTTSTDMELPNNRPEDKNKQVEGTSSGLQSLLQNYDSSESEWQ